MRIDRNQLPDLISTLRRHHLVFDFSHPLGDGAHGNQLLHPLNEHVMSHLNQHYIDFTASPLASSTDGFLYEKASWVLLELGKLTRDATASLLKVARVTTWNITTTGLSTLLQQTSKIISNPESPTPQLLYMGS